MSPLALSLHFLQAQPDNRLVALAREGHTPAFEALVRRYRKELLAYCRRLQPHTGSAEDALQQTLLQAWKALSAGADVREVRPWLYRIAHNVSLNQLRVVGTVPQDVSEAAGGQEVHHLVEQRMQARAALAGVASLPDLQRQAFVSTTLDGASHEEVASELGLSSGAVRGLIYRARATLRSAAAALTPTPALHWALRHAEARAGGASAVTELLAGGGGAGVAAAIAKGGAVLTLAGAVVGAGGAVLTHGQNHHRNSFTHSARPSPRAQAHLPAAGFDRALDEPGFTAGVAAGKSHDQKHLLQPVTRAASERGRDSGSAGGDHGGSRGGSTGDRGGRSPGGSDGGSSTRSSGSSDGGSTAGATIASSSDGSSSGGSSSGSSGSSEGGSSGSSVTSTSTTSGSNGGTSGGAGSSDGGQVSTTQTTSDGGSGSDGSSGATSGSSGSGDTTTSSTSS